MTSVALVDDHVLFRQGLRAILSSQSDVQVVGEASTALEAQEVVERTDPDVVVLDLELKGANGATLARELLRRKPDRKLLVVSMHTTEAMVAESFAAGVLGYAIKDQPADEIVNALRAVAQNQAYLSPHVSRFLVSDYLRLKRGGAVETGPLELLSRRERDVLGLLLRGYANGTIAQELCISKRTVETHRSRVLQKLNVHSLVDLFRLAVRHNLVTD